MAESATRRNREKEVFDIAMRLFAEKGYASTGIQDVANAVGVQKGSLYHYIETKEDFLFKIFYDAHIENEDLMAQTRALEVTALERLRFYLRNTISSAINNLERTMLYFRDWRLLTGERLETLKRQRGEYDHFLRELIVEAHEELGVDAGADVRAMSSFIIGATHWIADWYRSSDPDMGEEVIESYTHLAMVTVIYGADRAAAVSSLGGGDAPLPKKRVRNPRSR